MTTLIPCGAEVTLRHAGHLGYVTAIHLRSSSPGELYVSYDVSYYVDGVYYCGVFYATEFEIVGGDLPPMTLM